MQNIDWDQLQDQAASAGFANDEPAPGGKYEIVVADAEMKPTSTGKDMIKVRAKVADGPQQGKTIWTNMVLSPASDGAVAIFLRHLSAHGLGKEYFAAKPSLTKVAADLIGKRAVYEVIVKDYEGRQVNDVKNITPSRLNGSAPAATAPQTAHTAAPPPPPASTPPAPPAEHKASSTPAPPAPPF